MQNRFIQRGVTRAAAAMALAIVGIVGMYRTVEAEPASRSSAVRRGRKQAPRLTPAQAAAYRAAVERTAAMVSDSRAQALAGRLGLDILNLTWEDTGRYKGSSVGPNISDVTIQVATRDPHRETLQVTTMPVIRYPNFSDRTCDLDPRAFTLLVGNAHGAELQRVSLYDFLQEPTAFLTDPRSWTATRKTLAAPERDSKVLVSAQACFLPVPRQGIATFNPVIFNYLSSQKNPAVLTILATREGTSATIIDNTRDAFETGSLWGQRLFHNANGRRASLTGERESDFRAKGGGTGASVSAPGAESGMNMVLLIQVPLKYKEPPRRAVLMEAEGAVAPAPKEAPSARREDSNVENAVIGHGDLEGPYTEIDHLPIERDPRFPVRVTVQFYKATDNGIVSAGDLRDIKRQIDRVYAHSDYVGSLVTAGETGRITEYAGARVQPADWWERFWELRERETGESREQIQEKLRRLLGMNYQRLPVTDLYLRDQLRRGGK